MLITKVLYHHAPELLIQMAQLFWFLFLKLSFRHIPWRYILTSFPVWALIISNFTDCWGFYTFIMSFPSYLSDVLNYDIAKVSIMVMFIILQFYKQ